MPLYRITYIVKHPDAIELEATSTADAVREFERRFAPVPSRMPVLPPV